MVASNIYNEGQTAGRGFIGMATVIFGNWMPGRTGLGAYLFGFTDALRTRQEETVNALLIAGGLLLFVLAIVRLRRRRDRTAAVYAGLAAGFIAWFSARRRRADGVHRVRAAGRDPAGARAGEAEPAPAGVDRHPVPSERAGLRADRPFAGPTLADPGPSWPGPGRAWPVSDSRRPRDDGRLPSGR